MLNTVRLDRYQAVLNSKYRVYYELTVASKELGVCCLLI